MYWLVISRAARESESPLSRPYFSTWCWDQQNNLTHYSFIKFREVCVLVMHQYYDNTGAGCVQSTSPKKLQAIECEVICFQLPGLSCYTVSLQLIISTLHPPAFKMHYHNVPESCIVITQKSLISWGRRCCIIVAVFLSQTEEAEMYEQFPVCMR